MTISSIPLLPWPRQTHMPGGTWSSSSNGGTFSAAGHYQAYIACAAQDMAISHITLRPNSVTGSPTAVVSVETVGTDGLPTGVLWAANTSGTTATLTTALVTTALTATANISKGQIYCIKHAYNSGTSYTMGSSSNWHSSTSNLPYLVNNTGAAAKQVLNDFMMRMGAGPSSTTFYDLPNLLPNASVSGAATFDNTNSAARGMRFQVPFTCTCCGIGWHTGSSTGDYNAAIWSDSGSTLVTAAFDGDGSSNSGSGWNNLHFGSSITLSPGIWYRAGIEPTSATAVGYQTYTLGSAAAIGATPWGSNAMGTSRASGTWDDSATSTFYGMVLLLDGL